MSVCVKREFQMHMEHACILHAGGCEHKLSEAAGFDLQTPHEPCKAVFLKACHSLRLLHIASWAINILTNHFDHIKESGDGDGGASMPTSLQDIRIHVPSCMVQVLKEWEGNWACSLPSKKGSTI